MVHRQRVGNSCSQLTIKQTRNTRGKLDPKQSWDSCVPATLDSQSDKRTIKDNVTNKDGYGFPKVQRINQQRDDTNTI